MRRGVVATSWGAAYVHFRRTGARWRKTWRGWQKKPIGHTVLVPVGGEWRGKWQDGR